MSGVGVMVMMGNEIIFFYYLLFEINSTFSSLGQGEFRSSSFPLLVGTKIILFFMYVVGANNLIDAFTDIKICMVACGKSHTAALTST